MENGVPMGVFSRSSVAIDGIGSQIIPNSFVQMDSLNVNAQTQALGGYTVLSSVQEEPLDSNLSEIHIHNHVAAIMDSNTLASFLGKHVTKEASCGSLCPIGRDGFEEQFMAETPISSTSLATLSTARSGLQGIPSNFTISRPSVYPSEPLTTCISNDCTGVLGLSFGSSGNYGCDEVFGDMNVEGGFDGFPVSIELGGKDTAEIQPYSSTGHLDPDSWISSLGVNVSTYNPFGSCKFSNELSLSLGTGLPSAVNVKNIPDQCSEISFCTPIIPRATRLVSEQTSCNGKELSLNCGSNGAGQFSEVIAASKYLHSVQDILAQIARYSLENVDQMSFYAGGIKTGPFSSSYPIERRTHLSGWDETPNVNSKFEFQMDPAVRKRELEAKKSQLLTLLQMVDDQYSQCLDELHTVVSAFHAATELDPRVHTRFALQTISFSYKNLRERIAKQILSMGANFDGLCMRETQGSFETSYFQKQWTLQQLKKEHQLWRPQRGLPERSVSVLRAWMFQNFLHPYPKDAEKHLLAIKSGLTRNQVSNWFINARVRLWKPMIEEMYVEMKRRTN